MDNATSLSLARIVVGAAAWAAPELSLKGAMLDAGATQSPYLLRLFGARDVALGAATLLAAPEHRSTLLKIGLGVDAGDTAAAVLALSQGQVSKPTGVILAAAAGAAVAAGFAALAQR